MIDSTPRLRKRNTQTSYLGLYISTMSLGKAFILPTGARIPAVGFGTFANEGSKGETYKAVVVALEAGYRYQPNYPLGGPNAED